MKEKPDKTPSKPASWGTSMSIRPLKWILLAPVLALLLLGRCLGAEWTNPPAGQPEQMQSPVDYDPKLIDPFFQSDEWSYWEGSRENPDSGMFPEGELPRKLKHTARISSTSFGSKHEVRFCKARWRGLNMIDLLIHEHNPRYDDSLRVEIRNGRFMCQYQTFCRSGPREGLIWTTKRQKLTLDKKVYRKGDVIKGRIDFECLDELINPKYPDRPPRTIKVYGVFKTTVE